MKITNLNEALEGVKKYWKNDHVYNMSIGKNFQLKEDIMKQPTLQDVLIEMRAGFADAKADRDSIRESIKADISRLDGKIDDIVKLNNLKT